MTEPLDQPPAGPQRPRLEVARLWAGGLATAVVAALIALFTLGTGVNAVGQAIARVAPAAEVGSCGNACGACSLRDACQPAN